MKRRSVVRGGALVFLLIAGGVLLLYWVIHPTLSVIDPGTPMPDETVSIVGRNFGDTPGEVLFDNIPLPEHAVELWSPTYISFKMPNDVDSAVVRVRTAFGASNPLMLANSSKIPKAVASQAEAELRPNITGAKPTANIQIGKTIVIRGSHFGEPDVAAAIFFTRIPSISALETENPGNFIKVDSVDLLVESWRDASITVHVPDGVENGYVFVKTRNGTSNTYPISFSRSLGRTGRGESFTYVIGQKILLHVTASLPDGRLSLFLSKPAATQNQSAETIIMSGEDHLNADHANWQEFRFGQADASKSKLEVSRQFIVDTSEIRADINVASIQALGFPPPAFLAPYLASDAMVPSGSEVIVSAARAIQKKEKNPFRQVALAAQWVFSNVKLDEKDQGLSDDILSALKNKKGGMRAIALIDCALLRALGIPAIPVAGFLVTEDTRLIPHYWGEYYLLGIGWISFDPALATGTVPSGFVPGFSERLTYYRGIDSKHIAMSRGYQPLPPVQPEAQKKTKIPWSLFEYDELAQGVSYISTWNLPEIESSTLP
jgi:transglutaminase-like putative cysteine protease